MALYGLKEAGFFEKASFQGGTCLRVIHGLDRFSEDLDFVLREVDLEFNIDPFLQKAIELMNVYGYEIEVSGADKADKSVKTRFLKDDSIKKLLNFENKLDLRKKIQIKIEVDINPPKGAIDEINYLDFPIDFMVTTHDLPTLLSGKCHALLCRSYIKGRDWYDYLWYVGQGTKINIEMFQEAINQFGPWKGQKIEVTKEWLGSELENKIRALDWDDVKKDVEIFLRPEKKKTLDLWSEDFFLKKTNKFISFLE